MKQIDVTYNADGYIADMTDNAVHFEQEHESLQINATITTDKKVRAYIKAPNNNSTVTDELTPADGVYSFTVDGDYMAKGTMYVGFELYDDTGYIERLEPVKIYIDSFVSLGTDKNDNVYVVTVSVGEVETVDCEEPAEVENVGNKKDMILNFKIPRGVQGIKGDKGDKGDTGEQGIQGIQGVQGIQGEKGKQGEQGPQGEQGIPGNDGADGYTPVKGTDYFTESEILEISENIEQNVKEELEAVVYNVISSDAGKTVLENPVELCKIWVIGDNNETENPKIEVRKFKNDVLYGNNSIGIFDSTGETDKILRKMPGYEGMYYDSCVLENGGSIEIIKKIRKAVLDGTETWRKVSAHDNLFYCNIHTSEDVFTQTEIDSMSSGGGLLNEYIGFSNWFGKINPVVSQGRLNNAWMVNSGKGTNGYFTRLHIHSDEISTLEELTAKLSETPFIFYYMSVDGDTVYRFESDFVDKYINEQFESGNMDSAEIICNLEDVRYLTKNSIYVDGNLSTKSQNPVQNKVVAAAIGDMETALDSIISMQNELIGGDA